LELNPRSGHGSLRVSEMGYSFGGTTEIQKEIIARSLGL
jgi:alkylation response protein AidB-like acyl-CoA dehydrogenase